MRCFACNAEIPLAAGERVGFRDTCAACGADVHACRNCVHHDPSAYNECREPNAERVGDRERSNRCDYFAPGGGGDDAVARAQSAARSELEKLFKKS